jgi:hypothetical protein
VDVLEDYRSRIGSLHESLPLVEIDMRLAQDAAQGADWDFVPSRDDGYIGRRARAPNKLDVTAFLGGFDKASRFQSPLNFAEWERPKPPQPQPR